ncbi:1-phosphofructokinase family hexose kinase [Croceibacterium aestuarii]|uniref:1-phosphofructokinase family hexose kinase n=1 Tax=Croceibacterium aestuarii TaxID=3064139 RepID=UPI00272E98F4|nr:1-phosphofructokinase family hexose kinase [Croceibacterium sp. D39]
MFEIATLTMNPTIDVALEVDRIRHTHKLRGHSETHAPGGGGICVARVFVRLGGNARCYYLSGGPMGAALDGLLDLHQLVRKRIPIGGETRLCTTVYDRESGKEYRFMAEGPVVAEAEWRACLDAIAEVRCDYLVASGSLPQDVPADFYARVARVAEKRGIRFVLDSSGPALAQGLAGPPVFLVKPSLGEFRALTGLPLESEDAIAAAAAELARRGPAEHVVVTMGRDGALLANADGVLRLPSPQVTTASATGAGDSFVAAMVHALASGRDVREAFRFGMAGGAAAVLTPGSGLAPAAEIHRLYEQMRAKAANAGNGEGGAG